MKNKILILFILNILSCFCIRAQEIDLNNNLIGNMNNFSRNALHDRRMESGSIISLKTIQGNHYLPEHFVPGKIFQKDGTIFIVPLAFNMDSEDIEFQLKDSTVYNLLDPTKTSYVLIEDKRYCYVPQPDNSRNSIFMELLFEDKYNLFTRRTVRIMDAKPLGPYQEAEPAKFIRNKDKYFLQLPDSSYREISSIKSFIKVLPEKQKEIEKYIRLNKPDARDEHDMIKLMEYLFR